MPISVILMLLCLFQAATIPDVVAQTVSSESRKTHYWYFPVFGGLEELRKLFNSEKLKLLEKLNRRDLAHLARLDRLVVPVYWSSDELAYSPLPLNYGWSKPYPKALVVHVPSQTFGGYEQGRLVRWGPVSTGDANHPTPSGLFHLNWRSRGRHSTVNPDWYMPWYFNFENKEGLAFHAYQMEGYPASHGCIRLLERDAIWLFNWGEEWELDERGWNVLDSGTPVLILGSYDFNEQPPWHSLEWLMHGADLPASPISGQQVAWVLLTRETPRH